MSAHDNTIGGRGGAAHFPVAPKGGFSETAGRLMKGILVGIIIAGPVGGASMLRLSIGRRHLVWINRGSGGILLLSGAALLGSLLTHHFL